MQELKRRIKSFIPSDELIGFVDSMTLMELESVNKVISELNATGRSHTISKLGRSDGNLFIEARYYLTFTF